MGNKRTTKLALALLCASVCAAQQYDASKLRGRLIGTTAPSHQQGYGWNGPSLAWTPMSFGTQGGESNFCAPASASTTAYTCNLTPAISAYGSGGLWLIFQPDVTNTGASTVDVNSVGAVNIQKLSGGSLVAVAAGDLDADGMYVLLYDGSVFQLVSGSGGMSGSAGVNAQTGTTYTFLNSDCGKLVTGTNGGAQAYTLPQAGASGEFANTCVIDVESRGAGTITITPTTSTIDGAASLALTTDQGVRVFSDGTNYFTQRGRAVGTVSSVTGSNGVVCSPTTGAVDCQVTSAVVQNVGNNSPALGATGYNTISLPNEGVTGTTLNYTAINSGGTALIAGSSQADGVLGCVVSGAGNTGSAIIAVQGNVTCTFDGARTAGNWVVPSATDGQVHDTGSTTRPTSGQVLGTTKDTSGSGGAGTVLWITDNVAASASTPEQVFEFRASNNGGTVGISGGAYIPTGATGVGSTTHGLGGAGPLTNWYFAKGSPTDTSQVVFQMRTPTTFSGTINLDVEVETNSGTGVGVFGVETVCLASGDAWATPTFNPEQNLSTANIAATGNVYFTTWSLTATGCGASELLWVRFRRLSTNGSDTNSGDIVVNGWRFRLQ